MQGDQLARRLLTLAEVAPMVGYSVGRLEDFVGDGRLPIVRLPSSSGHLDTARGQRRVPVAWLTRWINMTDRRRAHFTAREDVGGQPGEPLFVSVAVAATAIGLTKATVYSLIERGRFCAATPSPSGTMRVAVQALDEWCYELVRAAEEAWYSNERGAAAPKAVARA